MHVMLVCCDNWLLGPALINLKKQEIPKMVMYMETEEKRRKAEKGGHTKSS